MLFLEVMPGIFGQRDPLTSGNSPHIMWDELWDKKMKRAGKHLEKALTAVKVKGEKLPGRYADGNGLYLIVDPSGAKRWICRLMVQGKRRDIGLGGLQTVSLAEARESALEARKLARSGQDPIAKRKEAKRAIPTFAEIIDRVHAEVKKGFKNEKHSDQWINTLKTYAVPFIGQHRVDKIETSDVLRVLAPIWMEKEETARRVRQRIKTVLDWAKANGFRAGENPVAGVASGLARQAERVSHHAALPASQIGGFFRRLENCGSGSLAISAFKFLILTACRTSEVLKAEWSEIDFEKAVWTIPASRMKAPREHRVPLPSQALSLLEAAKELSCNSRFVFPGRNVGKPMSNMVFLMLVKRLQLNITPHGFRSTFRDWASEQTSFSREVCEMALAHMIENKVESAYRRGDLLEKRRTLMITWADFIDASTKVA